MVARTVRPIHFEDFSGSEFERLVFAYHLRDGWSDLAWYGQTGSDQGRDIIGLQLFDDRPHRRTVIQCVNRESLTQAKAERDMANAAKAPTGTFDAFKFVCRCAVSAERRDAISTAAKGLGIGHVEIWSGPEFEEQVRLRAEFLVHRLVNGVEFPDAEAELRRFVDDFPDIDDAEAISMMRVVFDRPAFRTPFHNESSLPAFLRAIEDSIGALNTGIWRMRDAVEIRRIPSIHHIRDAQTRAALGRVVRSLDHLRVTFKRYLASGAIRHCGCGQLDCPTFMMDPGVPRELDAARAHALEHFRCVCPGFGVWVA